MSDLQYRCIQCGAPTWWKVCINCHNKESKAMMTERSVSISTELTTGLPQVDITAPHIVHVSISNDRSIIWVNVDGVCVLRACRVRHLEFDPSTRELKINRLCKNCGHMLDTHSNHNLADESDWSCKFESCECKQYVSP